MYEEERINIRTGIMKIAPSDRIHGLKLLEEEFDKIFSIAAICGFVWVIVMLLSAWIAYDYSGTLGGWIAVIGTLMLGWPWLMAQTQKSRQEVRKQVLNEVRAELEANNGLIDGQ